MDAHPLPPGPKHFTAWMGTLAVVLLLASGSGGAHADAEGDHGAIAVAVDRSTDPCIGSVRLSGMDHAAGTLGLYIVVPGPAPDQLVQQAPFNGTSARDGYRADVEGYEMQEGWTHYFVATFDGEGHHTVRSEAIRLEEGDCGRPQDEACFEVGLGAKANGDGSITVTAQGLRENGSLWRTSVGASAQRIATLTPGDPSHTDQEVQAGTTYQYILLIANESCARAEVASIPVFPTAWAAGAGIGTMLLAYVLVRR